MPSPTPTYRLDALRLEQVLENLKREHDKAKLSTFQRVSFTLLQIAAYSIPLACLVIWLLSDVASGDSRFAEVAQIPCAAAAVVLLIALVSMVVLVPMNLWLVRTMRRQARLDRQIAELLPGAGDAAVRPTRTPSQELGLKILAGASLLLVAAASALAVIGGEDWHWKLPIALVVFGGPAFFILSKKRLPVLALRIGLGLLAALMAVGLILAFVFREEFGLLGLAVVFLLVLLPALVLVSSRYFSRFRERTWRLEERMRLLDDVDRLRESLSRHRREAKTDGLGYVELASSEAERLVEVERSFIRQRRVAAIESAREGSASGHTIFKTHAARSRLEALDRRTRLLVESRLEELSFEAAPEGAAEGPEAGSYRLAVAGTEVEVVYEVAEEFNQVRILSVESAAGDGARTGASGGGGDG